MNDIYGRDLDLNLLRVFVVVATAGSVTRAAAQLYLTQPAISAALRRLTDSVGAPLFVRSGRGLSLTPRGQQLFDHTRPLLQALVEATLAPPVFDARQSDRVIRLGLSDGMEGWLLPRLMRVLHAAAPHMRMVAVPVHFRSVAAAFGSAGLDLAVSVADELPASIERLTIMRSRFVCLFDPRRTRLGRRISEREYFEHEHIIVSYNADLRGIIEDMFHKQRRVRCSIGSFSHIGALIQDSALLATIPDSVAAFVRRLYPKLTTAEPPFVLEGGGAELLWPKAAHEDAANRFVRERVVEVAISLARELQSARDNSAHQPRSRSARSRRA